METARATAADAKWRRASRMVLQNCCTTEEEWGVVLPERRPQIVDTDDGKLAAPFDDTRRPKMVDGGM